MVPPLESIQVAGIEQAKTKNEIQANLDPPLVFITSGIMLYAQMFQPTSESGETYIRRAIIRFILQLALPL